jgi:anhydro-N-acetylmuramic acid kinase
LQYQVQLIVSHGHTSFHLPSRKMTAQLGDGAALAARTSINVVNDLRAMDTALGGQGAPIVPIGEKLLLKGYDLFLNLGGIANISMHTTRGEFIAFDICPAGRVLNLLAGHAGREYDEGGKLAAGGMLNDKLLERLNELPYYKQAYPKSLANSFGTDTIYPMIKDSGIGTADALRTCVEHITMQISNALGQILTAPSPSAPDQAAALKQEPQSPSPRKMLVTGGGAHSGFLIERLRERLEHLQVEVVVPSRELIDYKEALIMALIGMLRWREEDNVLASVTGAARNSIGGAMWIGQE